jgi:hypothetical protein
MKFGDANCFVCFNYGPAPACLQHLANSGAILNNLVRLNDR